MAGEFYAGPSAATIERRYAELGVTLAPGQFWSWVPLSPFQVKALQRQEFELLMGGGKGSSKTDLVCASVVRQVHVPRFHGLILREDFPQTTEVIRRIQRWFRHAPQEVRPKFTQGSRTGPVFRWENGAEIEIGYIRTAADVGRYQGREWDVIGWDEMGNCPDPEAIDLLLAEIRSTTPGVRRYFRGSANPGKPGHAWCKARYVDPCGKRGERTVVFKFTTLDGQEAKLSRGYHHGTVYDNPFYSRDPQYLARLHALPPRQRKMLLEGDWDAAGGLALAELTEATHVVDAFAVPPTWARIAGYDWGFAHPFGLVAGGVDPDGTIFVEDSCSGHRLSDPEQARRIVRLLPQLVEHRVPIASGQDTFGRFQARVDIQVPSTAQVFAEYGLLCVHAADRDRAVSFKNLRNYVSWRADPEHGVTRAPKVKLMRTAHNLEVLLPQLQSIVEDPRDPEDTLKVDANPETGKGGDDLFDAMKNLCMLRPLAEADPASEIHLSAMDPEVLRAEYERTMRVDRRRRMTEEDRLWHDIDLQELAG